MPPLDHRSKAPPPPQKKSLTQLHQPTCKCHLTSPKKPKGQSAMPVSSARRPKDAPTVKRCTFHGCNFSTVHGGLTRHMLVHTGEKKHACKYIGCGFRAAHAHVLKNHIQRHNTSEPHVCIRRWCKFKSENLKDLSIHRRDVHGEVKREQWVSPSRDLVAKGAGRQKNAKARTQRDEEMASRGRKKGKEPVSDNVRLTDRAQRQSAEHTPDKPRRPRFTCRQDGRTTNCDHWDCAFRARKEQEAKQESRRQRADDSTGSSSSQRDAHADDRSKKRKRNDESDDSDAFLPEQSNGPSEGEDTRRKRRRPGGSSAIAVEDDEQEDVEHDEMDMLSPRRDTRSSEVQTEVRLPSPSKRRTPRGDERERSVKDEEEDHDELDTLSQAGSSRQSAVDHEYVAKQDKMMREIYKIRRDAKRLCTQGLRVEVSLQDVRPVIREAIREEIKAFGKRFQGVVLQAFEEQADE